MGYNYTTYLSVLGLLILANGFFVAAEFALVRIRKTRIEELVADGNQTARIIKDALDHIDDYISATQVGVTLASLGLGWLGEPFLADAFFRPFFNWILPANFVHSATSESLTQGTSVAMAFFAITFFHVVIGELTPKSLALQHPEKVSMWLIRPMRFFKVCFGPFIWLLRGASARLLQLIGAKAVSSHSLALSEEELLILLAESKRAGVVSAGEQQMLQRVFRFHDKTVREIMKPRPDINALNLRASEDEIRAVFEQGYSRVPVYDKSLNNVKGIVYVKDLIYTIQNPALIKLVDLIREALFVPETQPVSTLLQEFQKRKVHMAIVIDEHGDTAGLVTLEDVIEEIVGEIQDEYDSEPAEVQRSRDGKIIFDGKTSIDRLRDLFPNFEMPEGAFETIAGLIFKLAGRVPRESDVLNHSGLSFQVVKREGRRLRKISVERTPAETTHSDERSGDSGSTVEVRSNPDGILVSASSGGSDSSEPMSDEARRDDAKALAAEVTAREALPEESLDPEVQDAVPDIPEHGYEHDYDGGVEAPGPRAHTRGASKDETEASDAGDEHPDGVDNEPRFKSPAHARALARPTEKRRAGPSGTRR